MQRRLGLAVGMIALVLFLTACGSKREVVVYTAVDQVFAEKVFAAFEKESGIQVKPVYDTEATKTTGVVNRLVEEMNHPQADVFWNNEFSQTLMLQSKGVLQPYISPSAADIPDRYKEKTGYWTAFGGRARVFLVNTDKVKEADMPDSFNSLLDERYKPETVGMAYPVFGTTATQAAALYAYWGPEKAKAFYQRLAERKIRIVDGNSVVRDQVADGTLAFGMTDTDDALGAIEKGAHVKIVVPDQKSDQPGTLVVPNTVALIANAPHATEGKAFTDYILKKTTEKAMVEMGWCQITVRDVGATQKGFNPAGIKTVEVPYNQVQERLEQAQNDMKELFVR